MTVTPIARKTLGDALVERLELLDGIGVYPGEVPPDPPVITVGAVPDPAGRIAPYVVVYGGAGLPDLEPDLGDGNVDLLWSFQTTVAAGYEADALHAVDRVFDQLYRWSPAVSGLVCGRVKPPPGFDPGPVLRDDKKTPPRFWLPLQWQLRVTVN